MTYNAERLSVNLMGLRRDTAPYFVIGWISTTVIESRLDSLLSHSALFS